MNLWKGFSKFKTEKSENIKIRETYKLLLKTKICVRAKIKSIQSLIIIQIILTLTDFFYQFEDSRSIWQIEKKRRKEGNGRVGSEFFNVVKERTIRKFNNVSCGYVMALSTLGHSPFSDSILIMTFLHQMTPILTSPSS